MGVVFARLALLVLAIMGCAWFALGIRQAHDINRASAIMAAGRPEPVRATRVKRLLNAAGQLNPDSQVDLLRGELALLEGNKVGAQRVFASVVRREPQNVVAWLWVVRAASNVPEATEALAHIARLDHIQR